ncbi:unnamed protein product, partial [Ectocarpus sp. 8 AP-2014]
SGTSLAGRAVVTVPRVFDSVTTLLVRPFLYNTDRPKIREGQIVMERKPVASIARHMHPTRERVHTRYSLFSTIVKPNPTPSSTSNSPVLVGRRQQQGGIVRNRPPQAHPPPYNYAACSDLLVAVAAAVAAAAAALSPKPIGFTFISFWSLSIASFDS